MAIEIKELVVKTTVGTARNGSGSEKTGGDAPDDPEAIKAQILAECRNLFYELLNEQKER
jgi:hypothetical protein